MDISIDNENAFTVSRPLQKRAIWLGSNETACCISITLWVWSQLWSWYYQRGRDLYITENGAHHQFPQNLAIIGQISQNFVSKNVLYIYHMDMVINYNTFSAMFLTNCDSCCDLDCGYYSGDTFLYIWWQFSIYFFQTPNLLYKPLSLIFYLFYT